MFPPGRARLATNPEPTGSATTANTIGIVSVAQLSAAVTGVEFARITAEASHAWVGYTSIKPR
jgi:hypothetical protein